MLELTDFGICDLCRSFLGTAALVSLIWLAGCRGDRLRKHPDAEAVKRYGCWLLAAVPWIQAFIWAFKPTDIGYRRYPSRG